MFGIFTYIWAIYGVNGGKYSIHGSYGYEIRHLFGDLCANDANGDFLPDGYWSNSGNIMEWNIMN